MIKLPSNELYDLICTFLNRGTELLLDERQTLRVLKQIESVLIRKNLPWGVLKGLREILDRKGLKELAQKIDKRWLFSFAPLWREREVWLEADKVLLNTIISTFEDVSVTKVKGAAADREDLLSLSALFEAMRLGEVVAGNYLIFSKQKDVEALISTIRGAVAAIKLQPEKVVAEARLALEQLGGEGSFGLISMLENVDVTPEWSEAKQANLDGRILARALDHPSDAVAITAAELLYAGIGGDEVPDVVEQILKTGGKTALRMVSIISSQIWGDKALYIIIDRLDGELSAGCDYLFKSLPKLARDQTDNRIYKSLMRGIMAMSPEVAVGAAEGCAALDLPKIYVDELRGAFSYWKEHEPPYPVNTGVIPPSPRVHLLCALKKLQGFTFDEMINLCSDVRSDVREEAIDAIVSIAGSDKAELESILRWVDSGNAPSTLFTKLMSLPDEILQDVKGKILSLLKSSNSSVRSDVARTLSMSWIDKEEAEILANEMLRDEDHMVRNQATIILRLIRDI
jgi:hypothetical protein